MKAFYRESLKWPGQAILVGGLDHFLFFHILGIIIPTDELIFFRGVGQPPTRISDEHHPRPRRMRDSQAGQAIVERLLMCTLAMGGSCGAPKSKASVGTAG